MSLDKTLCLSLTILTKLLVDERDKDHKAFETLKSAIDVINNVGEL